MLNSNWLAYVRPFKLPFCQDENFIKLDAKTMLFSPIYVLLEGVAAMLYKCVESVNVVSTHIPS